MSCKLKLHFCKGFGSVLFKANFPAGLFCFFTITIMHVTIGKKAAAGAPIKNCNSLKINFFIKHSYFKSSHRDEQLKSNNEATYFITAEESLKLNNKNLFIHQN